MDNYKSQQLLRDCDITPTKEVLKNALGSANDAYLTFIEGIKNHDVELEWRYYNDGMAWLGKGINRRFGARGGIKDLCVFWLSIWDGFFKVTIYIPEKFRHDAINLPLDNKTKKMISETKQMGKLKFFPIVFNLSSHELLKDVYTLVDFKKIIK